MKYFDKEDVIRYTKECCENCSTFPKNLYENADFINYISNKMNESYKADETALAPWETMEYMEESPDFLCWEERYENAVCDMNDETRRKFRFVA